MTEYNSLKITILDDDDKPCNWVKVKHLRAHTEKSMLEISADTLPDVTEGLDNRNCRIIISGDNGNEKLDYQNSKQDSETIEIVVSQLEKLVK